MRKMKRIFGLIIFLCAVSLFWSIGYWIVRLVFPLNDQVSYLVQLLTVLIGFLLMAITGAIMGRLFNPKRMNGFDRMIEAIRQIARGDFNVKLDVIEGPPNHPFALLASSINDMAEELSELEQMRQTFISNVSHEIQSPLTSIRGFAHALQGDNLTQEERVRYLHIIEAESTRLSKLSDNLLKLTSLESEHHPFTKEEYRLDRQIKQVILACEPQWLAKEINIELHLQEVSIHADEELLNQVWTNILHNSIKFTNKNGEIHITCSQTDKQVVVQIADSGIGIPKEDQIHVFERFFKVDKARTRATSGSGLGLSIVKKIVDMHQGTIDVKSSLGDGTQMQINLPKK